MEAQQQVETKQPDIGPRAWDVADREIARCKEDLRRYNDPKNPIYFTVRERLNKWLDYRLAHGPDDEAD